MGLEKGAVNPFGTAERALPEEFTQPSPLLHLRQSDCQALFAIIRLETCFGRRALAPSVWYMQQWDVSHVFLMRRQFRW